MTTRIAQAGIDAKVPVILRVSASKADPNHDTQGFGLYFKYQGIADQALLDMPKDQSTRVLIFRPGSLDRGVEKREHRPWEQEIAEQAERGEVQTMDVRSLADAMIGELTDIFLKQSDILPGTSKIFSLDDLWELIRERAKLK